MTRRRQGGFTLIELMIALLVSSLLVGMILAIFSRMSLAYRGQQQIAGVQQVLAAARATIELDAKQAGLEVAQGFKFAADGANIVRSPVRIFNATGGPDRIALFYADTTVQAKVTDTAGWPPVLTVDTPSVFSPGDLVVAVNVDTTVGAQRGTDTDPIIARYDACVLKIEAGAGSVDQGSPGSIRLVTSLPWGTPVMTHCPAMNPGTTMVYRFVARGYRIDPARPALGALQQSQTGGLTDSSDDNWTDLAYGFTDLQTALQVVDGNDAIGADGDADGDGDPARDWYSSGAAAASGAPATGQDRMTQNAAVGALPLPVQMTISLVARTDRDVEGISSSQTPELRVAANPAHNALGDRAAVVFPTTDPALQGSRIFRYTTFQVDFRNLGVGR
ncbi:MAG TPA: prepilin-type N-terminal cleavage/methylation domain-containing protein [Kofleriaceae bacterium]|nr:prepilin-type N-terminal cleavage/methylation domain-containing protein [Kofleriaceae bacterium]